MDTTELQILCTSFPGVTEDIKWGDDLCFHIGNKMFCVIGLNTVPVTASFKVTGEEFSELIHRNGIKPAPYVARYKWVLVEDIALLSPKEWQHYIQQSYHLVKDKLPAKVKKELQ